jgi:hypothetical protein
MAVEIYESREAYSQALKSTSESTIGLITHGSERTCDGINVFTNVPQFGDIVLLDNNNRLRCIKKGTYSPASSSNPNGIPSNWTSVGVVGWVDGDRVLIINRTNASNPWIAGYLWRVSGWNLDGNSHTTNVTFYIGASNVQLEFSYQASSLEEVATQFTEFCDTNLAALSNNRYHAYIQGENLVVQKDVFNDYRQYQLSMSGLTVTNMINEQSPALGSSQVRTVNGLTMDSPVLNVGRWIGQYGSSTDPSYNPTSEVTSIPSTPVSLAAYKGQYCSYLRNIYGEGDEGYYKFISGYLPRLPEIRGIMAQQWRNDLEATKNLVQYRITRYGATESIPLYTAAAYCNAVGYDHPELAQGNWFLESVFTMSHIIPKLTYHASQTTWGLTNIRANADDLNKSLLSIGGSALPLSSYWWSVVRRNAGASWIFHYYGYLTANSFYLGFLCVPCCFVNFNSFMHSEL